MPVVDYSTKVADRAKSLLSKVDKLVRQKVFLGPGVMKLSPKESLARLKAMTPEERLALFQQQGRVNFMDEIQRLMRGK